MKVYRADLTSWKQLISIEIQELIVTDVLRKILKAILSFIDISTKDSHKADLHEMKQKTRSSYAGLNTNEVLSPSVVDPVLLAQFKGGANANGAIFSLL